MPQELIPSFLFYCLLSSISPGASNLASMGASLNCERRRALRQWYGMITGFLILSIIAVAISYCLGRIARGYVKYLACAGAAYIAWLAFHLLRSGDAADAGNTVYGFRNGLLVQVTNAQGLVYCITTLSAYVLPYRTALPDLIGASAVIALVAVAGNLLWLVAGGFMKGVFQKHRKAANTVMALALLLCAANLLISSLKM